MKRITSILAAAAFVAIISDAAVAQTASQNLTLTVDPIALISVSGDPAALVITGGTEGTDALTGVSNSATTYSITHNATNSTKITASIDAGLTAGWTLKVTLASTKGTSVPAVDISNATAAVDVVTGINRGADQNQTITYDFSATASSGAGTLNPQVTLTLVAL